MKRNYLLYLDDILKSIHKIETFIISYGIGHKIKVFLSFILTAFALSWLSVAIMMFFNFTYFSLIISGFFIGLYIFASKISNIKYDNFFIEPVSFSFHKFVKVMFMPSLLLSFVTSLFYPELVNNFSLNEIEIFIENAFTTISVEELKLLAVGLPIILGIFGYFIIRFLIYWYLIILWNLLLFQIGFLKEIDKFIY